MDIQPWIDAITDPKVVLSGALVTAVVVAGGWLFKRRNRPETKIETQINISTQVGDAAQKIDKRRTVNIIGERCDD